MTDQTCSGVATAQTLIEQCRREIESGWHHLEAAREILRRSCWLVARWEAQRRADFGMVKLPNYSAARAEMFVFIQPASRHHRRRKARSSPVGGVRNIRKDLTKPVTRSERA